MSRATNAVRSSQVVLAALLVCEIAVFAVIGKNFFTWANFAEVARQSVELGLLSLALTLVIATGGIDLSVGSLLGLSAVVFGKLWRDGVWEGGGFSTGVAAVATLVMGALAGGLNGALITRLSIPPLIVTLGTYSLFRGLAEGMTGGVDNFTNFPDSFLEFGQGTTLGVPTQVWVFIVGAAVMWVVLHRSIIGRELTAIGYSPSAARHAAIPVERRLLLVYTLAGVAAALAGVIYTARVGQAKADAGIGFELSAITAVVLGGTSIFGGRATVGGTLLGLAAIAVLQNGLRLADLSPELAGVLTGCLLLAAIGFDSRERIIAWLSGSAARADATDEELTMRNSQLAALCGVILLGAGIVAGANFWLVRSLQRDLDERSAGGSTRGASANTAGDGKTVTVAMMPKSKGNAYFIACRKGAEEAAKELGVELLWDGPTDPDPAKQNEIVETWITRGVDVIAVAVENREGLSTALRKAREKGIKVITWDADAEPDARDFFVNQATPEGIANTLMDKAAELMGGEGEFAIITATLTAANQNEWLKHIEARRESKYPKIEQPLVRPCDDLQPKAFDQATAVMNAHPNVELIMAICSPAVPGAAEAVKQAGRSGEVKVIGLGLPNDNKPYVHQGVTQAVILWNTMDLGYLTVYASKAVVEGQLKPGDAEFNGGRLGKLKLEGDSIVLGQPFVFNKGNIDEFDF
jgi:rhamnose transport system permease protein